MLNFDNCVSYKVFVGLNDAESKKQEIATEDAMIMVSLYLASHFEGATVYPATGVYRHNDGTVVRENSLVIELVYVTDFMVESLVQHCQKILNQESIMIMRTECGVQFYGD